MKKLLTIFLVLVSFSKLAVADDSYVYENKDSGQIEVTTIRDGVNIVNHLKAHGVNFGKIIAYSSNLPGEDPKYWKFLGNSIVVDDIKKQADIDSQNQKQAAKDAVLAKLKINRQDLKDLLS